MTDAPTLHQELAALTAIATVIGRVETNWKQRTLPNVSVNILGRTYTERKTKGTLRCLRDIMPERLLIDVTDFSPQSLQTKVQENEGEGLLIIDEYGMFLRDCRKRDYMAGTKRLLMKFYDSASLIKGTYSNPVLVREPYVNVFCLSTRGTVIKNVDEYDITSGLLGRQIHAYAERERYLDPSRITKKDREGAKGLKLWLENLLRNRKPSVTFESKAARLLKAYKKKIDDLCLKRNDDIFSSIAGRYGGDYSIKWSILYQFSSENPLHMPLQVTIGEDAVKRGIAFNDKCIDIAMSEFIFHVTANRVEKVYRWIENLASKSEDGWAQRRDLMHKVKLYKDELDRVIETLESQADILRKVIPSTKKGGRTGEKYKPVRAIRRMAKKLKEV